MKIGIISLGWLGKQLYRELESIGQDPWGTYRHYSKGLKNEVAYDFNAQAMPQEISSCEWIVFNLPPSVFSFQAFENFIRSLGPQKLVFVSSTSVYGQAGSLDEKDRPRPKSKNGKLLLRCEDLVLEHGGIVIRPGGLYGKERHPGNYLSGKETTMAPGAPVNLVGGEDLVKLICNIFATPKAPKIINAVNSHHPSKQAYYEAYCHRQRLSPPVFTGTYAEGKSKVVRTCYENFKISTELP